MSLAHFRSLYAFTWYLDAMTDGEWCGLIYGDYKAVMPILPKKKYYIPYVIQPFLCQQLGIYARDEQDINTASLVFFTFLKANYFKVHLSLHEKYEIKEKTTLKSNQVLLLGESYESIQKKYNRNTLRNINAALSNQLVLIDQLDQARFLNFMVCYDTTGLVKKHTHQISNLFEDTQQRQNGLVQGCFYHGELVAVAYFIILEDTLYFLLCASSDMGKEQKAMYYILDEVIKRYAKTMKKIDFTGSSIDSIARRNIGFGAETVHYHQWEWSKWYIPNLNKQQT